LVRPPPRPPEERRFRRYAISFLIALPLAIALSIAFPARREDLVQFAAFLGVGVVLFGIAWFLGGRIDDWLEHRGR
jgi:hypothetical protein